MQTTTKRGRIVTTTVVISAVSILGMGVWARTDPAGFAEFVNWPNHEHFLHDAGVFQIGIGLMMLAALWWRDAIAVGLAGFFFTNSFHAVNHVLDQDKGGKPTDWWNLAIFSVVALVGLVLRLRALSRAGGKRPASTS